MRGVQTPIARPDDPRRYDVAIAALAKTAFTSGKHYWEVQVKDRSCFVVGVASEMAPRKGVILYRPSIGYFTLHRLNGKNYKQSDKPELINLVDQLNIIGILLDYHAGEVAFYNAETKALLFTFSGYHFTVGLYPFVATCGTDSPKEWPIELLDTALPLWLKA